MFIRARRLNIKNNTDYFFLFKKVLQEPYMATELLIITNYRI